MESIKVGDRVCSFFNEDKAGTVLQIRQLDRLGYHPNRILQCLVKWDGLFGGKEWRDLNYIYRMQILEG